MASEATFYWANTLGNLLRGVAITELSTVYLGLHTADPTRAGLFTAELAVGGYVRMAAALDAFSSGNSANTDIEQWVATGAPFPEVTYASLNDAVSGGNMLYKADLPSGITVAENNIFQFAAAAFTIAH